MRYIVKHDETIIDQFDSIDEAITFVNEYINKSEKVKIDLKGNKVNYVRKIGPNNNSKIVYWFDFGSWSHFIYIEDTLLYDL